HLKIQRNVYRIQSCCKCRLLSCRESDYEHSGPYARYSCLAFLPFINQRTECVIARKGSWHSHRPPRTNSDRPFPRCSDHNKESLLLWSHSSHTAVHNNRRPSFGARYNIHFV
ncbi:unnamed protein product, partial [Ectocarpus sp. 12 AP-2014]